MKKHISNVWDEVKTVIKNKNIGLNIKRKEKKYQINNVNFLHNNNRQRAN